MKSIKTRITLIFSMICVVIILLLSSVSYFVSTNAIESESKQKMLMASEKYSEMMNGWLDGQAKIVNEIAYKISNDKTFDEKEVLTYLSGKLKANPNTTDVYMATTDKHMIDGSGWVPDASYDPTTRPWYKSAIEKNGVIYTAPFLDKVTQKIVISIAAPVTRDNKVIGVISSDINLGKLTEIIEKAKPVENSYSFLFDSDKNIIIHPNKDYQPTEKESKNISKILDGKYDSIVSASANKQGVTLKDYDGKERYFISSNVAAANWKVGFGLQTAEFKKPLNNLIRYLAIVIGISLIIAILAALYFGNQISRPILKLTKLVNKTKSLDLVYDPGYDKLFTYKDEIGVIANAIGELRVELRGIVEELRSSSNEVLTNSDNVAESVKDTVDSIENVNSTVTELAKGAVQQASDAQESMEKLSSFADKVNNVSDRATEVKKYSTLTDEVNKEGINSTELLSRKLQENTEAAKKVSENIGILSSKSDVIGQIVNTIQAIASQTNLLALNAAIEAARAGESGKGFAVVADEVRKLAEQTSESTKQISDMIQEIQNEIQNAKNNMDNAERITSRANESMIQAEKSFKTIGDSVIEMNNNIDKLIEQIYEVNNDKDTVVNSIQGISAISEEFAASTEEVSASMEEQTRAVEIIKDNTDNLRNITNKLNEIVSKFII